MALPATVSDRDRVTNPCNAKHETSVADRSHPKEKSVARLASFLLAELSSFLIAPSGFKVTVLAGLGSVSSGDRQYRGLCSAQWRWAGGAAGRTDGHIAGGRSTLRPNLPRVN